MNIPQKVIKIWLLQCSYAVKSLCLSTVTFKIFTISFSKWAMKQIYIFSFKPTTVWNDVMRFWKPLQKTDTDILRAPCRRGTNLNFYLKGLSIFHSAIPYGWHSTAKNRYRHPNQKRFKINWFFLLQEWASYGAENKMESANNVMLRDYMWYC